MTKYEYLKQMSTTGLEKLKAFIKKYNAVIPAEDMEVLYGNEALMYEKSWNFNLNEVEAELESREP